MFGRIRPSPSSLETLEGSPSKILKDDSFSIYEATLMKLKLGAQRDTSAFSKEADEILMNDSATSSPCIEGTNVVSNYISASSSSSQHKPNLDGGVSMMIDSDYSSISASPNRDQVSTVTSEQQPRHSNISIIHFFSKLKGSRRIGCYDSSCGESIPTESDRPASASSSPSEQNYRSETESIQSSLVSELME